MALILSLIFLITAGKNCNELSSRIIKTYAVSDFSCKAYRSNIWQPTIEKWAVQDGAYAIWYTTTDSTQDEYVTFIKVFHVIGEIISANFIGRADDKLSLSINNHEIPISEPNYWTTNHNFFITDNIVSGENVVNLTVFNWGGGPGFLYFKIIIESKVYV